MFHVNSAGIIIIVILKQWITSESLLGSAVQKLGGISGAHVQAAEEA